MFEARLAVWNARRGGVTDSARLGVTQDSKVMYQMFRIILLYHNMSMQAWTGWHAWLLYPKNSIGDDIVQWKVRWSIIWLRRCMDSG